MPRPGAPEWVRVAALAVVGGIVAGLIGAAVIALVLGLHMLAFGVWHEGEVTTWLRRLVAPSAGGVLIGLAWWWLRRRVQLVSADAAARDPAANRMPLLGTLGDAVLQVLIVGTGASLGREGAPRQAASVVMQRMASRLGIRAHWHGLLIASAAGAGLAAVYHVPLAGAVFAMEVVRRRASLQLAVVALPMALIATWLGSLILPNVPIYTLPAITLEAGSVLWLALGVPVCWIVGVAFDALTERARTLGDRVTRWLPVTIGGAGIMMGIVAVFEPSFLGNGIVLTQLSLDGGAGAWLLGFAVVKALLTAMFFAAGAHGGRLTPALAVGAATGAGLLVAAGGSASEIALAALAVAVGVLAISQRAPAFAVLFGWELTGADPVVMLALVPVAVAAYAPSWWLRSRRARH